jgi:hypothetical protein
MAWSTHLTTLSSRLSGRTTSMSVPFNGLTVLVIEDDWFVREDIASGLRHEGWTVLEAAPREPARVCA